MDQSLHEPILVLNKSWLAIDSAPVCKAMGTVVSKRAVFIDVPSYTQHDIWSWMNLPVTDDDNSIKSNHGLIKIPELMLLCSYNKQPKRQVVFNRRNLWRRDKRICQYCGQEPPYDEITIDHVIPKSRGGQTTFNNCVLACSKCNLKKGRRSLGQAGMKLRRTKKTPTGETVIYYNIPKKPMWNPLYAVKRKIFPKSWSAFLRNFDETLYWEVELED